MAKPTQKLDQPSWRPTLVGRQYAVASGHYLATIAAQRVLENGGNAIDAGVTASISLGVLLPHVVSIAGVAPTLIYLKDEERVVSLAGLGYWPAATDIQRLRAAGNGAIPEGILRTVVPAAPATYIRALRSWGTISFEEAAMPAFQLARDGFYMNSLLNHNIQTYGPKLALYPENRDIFFPGGKIPAIGTLFKQEHLGATLYRLIEAERSCAGNREAKLRAVHDCFYHGSIADDIAAFYAREGGFLTKSDLQAFEVPVEAGISCTYNGYTVHSCDAWCQGIVLLEALKILEGIDVRSLGLNSARFVHTVASALNLAFADREAYVADPKFVNVPVAGMLADDYGARQRARIDAGQAFLTMPAPGGPAGAPGARVVLPRAVEGDAPIPTDTSYACVADRHGNAYSATVSDSSFDGPMVPGMGLLVSTRGSQSRLEDDHPSSVAPGKRPRLTPSPALALKDSEFFMAFGTPGGDMQTQAMLQVFLNVTQFGLQLQPAIESPRFGTFNFPNSFSPYDYRPARLGIESRVPRKTISALRALGYDVEQWSALALAAAGVCAIKRDAATGLLHAGADPRRESYAAAW